MTVDVRTLVVCVPTRRKRLSLYRITVCVLTNARSRAVRATARVGKWPESGRRSSVLYNIIYSHGLPVGCSTTGTRAAWTARLPGTVGQC